MRVITLARGPRFPSRASALLEYAREKLNEQDVDVYHWKPLGALDALTRLDMQDLIVSLGKSTDLPFCW